MTHARTLSLLTACTTTLSVGATAAAQDALFPGAQYPNGGFSYALELGDWNGDGELDVVSAHYFPDGAVSVALGLGDGSFADPVTTVLGGDFKGIALGNLDGNADLDAVVTDESNGDVIVILGDGASGATSTSTYSAGIRANDVALADLDGDGDTDLVVAAQISLSAGGMVVSLGDGSGGFGPPTTIVSAGAPERVTLADIDGDGLLDAALSTAFPGISLHQGDGAGGFSPPLTLPTTYFSSGPVSVADLDADGDADLVVPGALSGQGALQVLLADGLGGFSPLPEVLIDFPLDGELADLDGDGALDMATCAVSSIQVSFGDGAGGFTPAAPFSGGWTAEDVEIADLDGDGALDLVTANRNILEHTVFLAVAPGQFGGGILLPLPVSITAPGDLDGDGTLDLAAPTANGLEVLFGVGDGSFTAGGAPQAPGISTQDAIVADFDGDGVADVAACGGSGGPAVQLWLGTGGGAFTGGGTFPVGTGGGMSTFPIAIDAGDLDGDGVLDLITADQLSQPPFFFDSSLSTLIGDGLGGFGAAHVTTVPLFAADVELDQLNGDPFADAAVAVSQQGVASVYPGDGLGGFGTPDDYPAVGAVDVLVTDVDADGVLDLLVGKEASFSVSAEVDVLLGHGDGTFTGSGSFTAGEELRRMEPGDLTGDGILDLAVSGDFSQVVVLAGDGLGGFAAPEIYTGYGETTLGDFDADGSLDRVDSGANGYQVVLNLRDVPTGVAPYGTGTPGCDGFTTLSANLPPLVPEPAFGLTATGAPPETIGFFYRFDAPSSTGFLLLDLLIHVDLGTLSLFTVSKPIRSDAGGTAFGALPIPNNPNLVGLDISAQAFWPWLPPSPCAVSAFGLSSSRGVTLTFL